MLKLSARSVALSAIRSEAIVTLVVEDQDIRATCIKELADTFPEVSVAVGNGRFEGKQKEIVHIFTRSHNVKIVILVGLGRAVELSMERLRRASALGAKRARELKCDAFAALEPHTDAVRRAGSALGETPWSDIGQAVGEGASLALYSFEKYQSEKQPSPPKELTVVSADQDRTTRIRQGLSAASIIAEGTMIARDLANAPGNEIYPETLADRIVRLGRTSGFRTTVFDQRKIGRMGMGGLIGVSQGSSRPPRFIQMEYSAPGKNKGTIVLVGKGVTFDAGGISIKPSEAMAEMKMDMSGAAAVAGAVTAIARLKLPVHVVGLVPATENLLGSKALKPGDILTHHNGKTSEIDNTDAEGRLILADALSYASKFSPAVVIDLATLTGACVVALGHYATGMMGNDEEMMTRLRNAGDRTYERVWPLPMFEEYEKLIKSDVADVKNVGGRWGGAITAALFLKKFIGPYKWIHLDIAGPAIMPEPQEYIPKGGSGVGVRLLVDFARHW